MIRTKFQPVLALTPIVLASIPPSHCQAQTVTHSAQDIATPLTITVGKESQQTFGGFGTSLGNWGDPYGKLPAANRAQLSQALWKDLKFKTLRLWFNTDKYAPTTDAHDLSEFRACYVDSGIIADARKNGVTTLLLAPDATPPHMAETRTDGTGSFDTKQALKESETENYAVVVADFIERLKKETGILIDVTGIQNEPNNIQRFTPAQIVRVTKKLRSELDQRGLKSVKIISPEGGSVDGIYYETVDALKADPVAWKSLIGVASHSYNNAATDKAAAQIAGTGKEYWMTEASDNGAEEPGDAIRAASLASRFLNDVNQRTTHWIHFLGFETPDPKDNATRILSYTSAPFAITRYQKYWYYQQLSQTFDTGAVFRHSTSNLDGEMIYTYGKKPRINAATAKNPDGTWAIGLSNYTSPTFPDASDPQNFERHNSGYSARTFDVTITIPELAGKTVRFAVRRSNSGIDNIAAEPVILQNGTVTVRNVRPLDLVTLRSVQ